jgi:hypothetical protein
VGAMSHVSLPTFPFPFVAPMHLLNPGVHNDVNPKPSPNVPRTPPLFTADFASTVYSETTSREFASYCASFFFKSCVLTLCFVSPGYQSLVRVLTTYHYRTFVSLCRIEYTTYVFFNFILSLAAGRVILLN